MARLAFTLTLLLFLFAFAYARTPFQQPGNDVTDPDQSIPLPESDAKPTLLLPSEKATSEPVTFVEFEPETAETKPLDTERVDLLESETRTVDAVPLTRPLTVVRFRPVNRHFRRGCHHGMKPMMRPRFHGREMSYGDDMIPSAGRKEADPEMAHGGERHMRKEFDPERFHGGERQTRKEFDPEMFHGGQHQMRKEFNPEMFPERWERFHHHHPHHHHHHDDMFANHRFRRPFRREEGEEEREDEGREEREEGGFLNRFRKFLNGF